MQIWVLIVCKIKRLLIIISRHFRDIYYENKMIVFNSYIFLVFLQSFVLIFSLSLLYTTTLQQYTRNANFFEKTIDKIMHIVYIVYIQCVVGMEVSFEY